MKALMLRSCILSLLFLCTCVVFGSTQAMAAQKIRMKFSVMYNPKAQADAPSVHAILKFKEEMERRCGDKISITLYWDDQLAKNTEAIVNGLQNGLIHFSQIPMSAVSEYSKAMIPFSNLFMIPYPHFQIAYDAIDGSIGKEFIKRVSKDTGLRPVAFWEVGFRHLTTVKKPVQNLADLKGMKIRVQPNPVHLAAFSALGANATPVSWGETFTALQQGVVDGAENPYQNIVDARLHEVQQNLSLTGHAFEFVVYLTSEKFYQGLPADVRQAWDESLQVATKLYRERMLVVNKKNEEFLRTKMKFIDMPEAELAKFRQIAGSTHEVTDKLCTKEYFDWFKAELKKYESAYFAKIKK